MRHKQSTFLAGVAALALFAASGAFAQQGQAEQKGGAAAGGGMHSTQNTKSPGGMKQGGMTQGGMKQGGMKQGGTSGQNQNAQSERQPGATATGGMANGGKSPSDNRSAQDFNKNNKGAATTNRAAQQRGERGQTNAQSNAQSRTTQSRDGSENGRFAAQPENRNRRGGATAQRNESLKGLQGNTTVPMQGARGAGANVTLNDQQRTQIRDTIINGRGAPRVGSVDFDVNVGTVVPRGHLHLVRVPQTLVRIDPGWRGFLYFVYNDEVVIVDPHDMRIVQVLPV
jgi:Protein of unknown function (DUF1236)